MRLLSPLALAAALWCAAVPAAAADEQPRGEWPLRPRPEVIERFDPPDSPYGAGHRGVDLLGQVGQPVHAALGGTVTYAGMLAGRGVVVVDHGATRTTYEPVSASVTLGTSVTAGSRIGRLELPGSHCFPRSCLHWGWIAGDTYLDPLRLVGAGPVRLLPLWRAEPVVGTVSRGLASSVPALGLRLGDALGGMPFAVAPW
jgi:murein DD-endopeptidase MepM/ murein hydrolase activator NlpD